MEEEKRKKRGIGRNGLPRRRRRGSMAAVILWGSFAHLRGPKVSKGERREAGIQWIQPPKAVSDRSFRQTTSGAHGSANRADCLPRGKPFGAPAGAQLLPTGPDAPTAARVVGLVAPRGNPASLRGPKVSKGERREAGIQWIQPPKAVSDRSFRQTTSGAHGSANRADCLPRGKPFGAPAGAQLLPTGLDAPTAARTMGLPPRRGIVLSFDAKESTKESKRHGDSCGPPRYASRASVCGSPFGAVLDLGSLRSPFREKGSYCPF